jgi:hypothetical protein
MAYYFPTTNLSLSDICSRGGQTGVPYSLGALRGKTIYNRSGNGILLLANRSISIDSFKDRTFTLPTTTTSVGNYQYDDRHDDSYTLGSGASCWLLDTIVHWPSTWSYDCWGGWQNLSYQTNGTKIYSITITYTSGCNTGGSNSGGRIISQSISITTTNPAVTYSLNTSYGAGAQTVAITDGCGSFQISIHVEGFSALYSGYIDIISAVYYP